jgi:hypothetical protein
MREPVPCRCTKPTRWWDKVHFAIDRRGCIIAIGSPSWSNQEPLADVRR